VRSFCEEARNLKQALSVNRLAWWLLEELIQNPDFYAVEVEKTTQGATIIDAGINAKGGFQAGKLITEICMGGLGKAEIASRKYGDLELPSIFVYTDHPAVAALGSQFAGWHIKEAEYSAIGSGPARALALKPGKIYEEIGYKDTSDRAIIILETEKFPSAELFQRVSKDCHVKPEKLAVILTPTNSLVGAIQISGRVLETGIHKLRKVGLDSKTILGAWGCAPIPAVHPEFATAMARANDAILYGGSAFYTVKFEDEDKLKDIVEGAPSIASKAFGTPFIEIFKAAKYDFYKIDPNLFAPAVVVVNNVKTGHVFRAGQIMPDILKKSFGYDK
jgi:methenyltetrahydromethanopterin cyclohydrolase